MVVLSRGISCYAIKWRAAAAALRDSFVFIFALLGSARRNNAFAEKKGKHM